VHTCYFKSVLGPQRPIRDDFHCWYPVGAENPVYVP
jgi:hypothetical protein